MPQNRSAEVTIRGLANLIAGIDFSRPESMHRARELALSIEATASNAIDKTEVAHV